MGLFSPKLLICSLHSTQDHIYKVTEKFFPRSDSIILLSFQHEQWSCCVHESAGIVMHGETDRYSGYRVCAIKLDTVPIPFTRPAIRCGRLFEPCELRPCVTQPVGKVRLWQGTCIPSCHQCLQHWKDSCPSTLYWSVQNLYLICDFYLYVEK